MRRVQAISVVMDGRVAIGANGQVLRGLVKPVVVNIGLFFWHAANDDRGFWTKKGVVVDVHPRPGNGGVVFAVSPAVHVKTVAEGLAEFDIVARFVPAAGVSRARYRMPVGVEEVVRNQGLRDVVRNAVSQAVVLVVVDEIVVDEMPVSAGQGDGRVTPAGEFAVIDFEMVVLCGDAVRGGEFVIIAVPPTFGKRSVVVLETRFGIGAANAETRDAHIGTARMDQGARVKGVAGDHPAGRAVLPPIAGKRDAFGDFDHEAFDIHALRAIDGCARRDKHDIARPRLVERAEQLVEGFDRRGRWRDWAFVALAAANCTVGRGRCAAGDAVELDSGFCAFGHAGVEHGGFSHLSLREIQEFGGSAVCDVFAGLVIDGQEGEFDQGRAGIRDGQVRAKEEMVRAAFFDEVGEVFHRAGVSVQAIVNFSQREIDIPVEVAQIPAHPKGRARERTGIGYDDRGVGHGSDQIREVCQVQAVARIHPVMLARIFKPVWDKDREIAFGAGLHRASDFRPMGWVVVVLRK